VIFHVMKGIFKRQATSAPLPRVFATPTKVAASRPKRETPFGERRSAAADRDRQALTGGAARPKKRA
jgi:hypothetical protein